MKNVANSIEDLLETLAGLQGQSKMQIESNDATIMNSIARQTFKGTALTDRQYALMKEKLQYYRDQFTALEYDFDRAVDTLRQPLRHIDRSKYIKIVSHSEMLGPDREYESYKKDWKWIKIRFPFAKKLIIKVNELSSVRDYYHEKGSHEHYFKLTEKNIVNVIEKFKDSEFEIQQELIEYYNKIEGIKSKKELFVPRIFNYELINVSEKAKTLAEQEIGKLDKDTLIKYIDRRQRYGIVEHDAETLTGDFIEDIVFRKDNEMLFKPSEYNLNRVLESIERLDRYPLLVLLDEDKADEQLYNIYNFYKDFLPSEEQCVLFRTETDKNSEFNQMVADYKLNNWLDNNTKVVYINTNKLPKLLLSSDWRPVTTFTFNSRINRIIDLYIKEFSDLIIFYDNEISPIRRYSRYYG